jgi:hypothetical protein
MFISGRLLSRSSLRAACLLLRFTHKIAISNAATMATVDMLPAATAATRGWGPREVPVELAVLLVCVEVTGRTTLVIVVLAAGGESSNLR